MSFANIIQPNDFAGFSDEAKALKEITKSFSDPIVRNPVSEIRQTVYEELIEAANIGSKGNFDHYGAKQVQIETFNEVSKFIELFPFSDLLMKPDVLIEPDGSLELDWENQTSKSSIALSFSGKGVIHYAGLFGNDARARGVEKFDEIWIPKGIIQLIQRVWKES